MGKREIVAALALASFPAAQALAEGAQSWVAAFHPGVSWYLRYELDGVLEDYNNHKPGVSTYTMARSETSGMLVSAQISRAGAARSAADCREAERRHMRQNKALAKAEIRVLDASGTELEVLVPVGEQAVSRHVHRFWLRDGLCAKLHASKTPFAESDRAAFAKVIESVRFEPAAATFERAFAVPGRGTLVMSIPAAWGFRTARPSAAGRDIEFMHPGSDARMLVTLLADARTALKDEKTARPLVESLRDAAGKNALERDPPLVPLKGAMGEGYYFFVTDRNLADKPPRREDWKYLSQGALLMGESLLFFSVFSNVRESPEVDGALRAIGEARLVPPSGK